MIHIALLILAVWIIWKAAGYAVRFVFEAFDASTAYGCLSLVAVVLLGMIVLVIAC